MSWGGVHGRDHRRGGGMGVPGTVSQISPMKKTFSSNVIAPPKFPRSTAGTAASLTPKSWMEDNVFRTDSNSNTLLPLQVRVGNACVVAVRHMWVIGQGPLSAALTPSYP